MFLTLGMSLLVVYNVTIMFDVAVFMLTLSCAELPANWAQWWWWRFNGKARVAASFGGAAIFCIVVLGPKLLLWMGVHLGGVASCCRGGGRTFLVMGLTTVLWVAVALLTRARPAPACWTSFTAVHDRSGSWGPIRAAYLARRAADGRAMTLAIGSSSAPASSSPASGAVATMLYIVGCPAFMSVATPPACIALGVAHACSALIFRRYLGRFSTRSMRRAGQCRRSTTNRTA